MKFNSRIDFTFYFDDAAEINFLRNVFIYYLDGLEKKIKNLEPKKSTLSEDKFDELQDAYYRKEEIENILKKLPNQSYYSMV